MCVHMCEEQGSLSVKTSGSDDSDQTPKGLNQP